MKKTHARNLIASEREATNLWAKEEKRKSRKVKKKKTARNSDEDEGIIIRIIE